MMFLGIIRRTFFYGFLLFMSTLVFFYLDLSVTGKSAYKVFLILAVISGAIQSINFLVIQKISDVQKIKNVGFWASWRLRHRVESRRKTAFYRALVGVLAAIGAGAFSAWMSILDLEFVPYWGLGLATGVTVISIVMLFLTLYEFFVVTKLEADMNWKSEKSGQKRSAIKSIKGDE